MLTITTGLAAAVAAGFFGIVVGLATVIVSLFAADMLVESLRGPECELPPREPARTPTPMIPSGIEYAAEELARRKAA